MTDFDAIRVGDSYRFRRTIGASDIANFAALSGDFNPLHVDGAYAASTKFKRPVAHGMLTASYVSAVVGMHLPGRGALWREQRFVWRAPVYAADELDYVLEVTHKSAGTRTVVVALRVTNQAGVVVMEGSGEVMTIDEARESLGNSGSGPRVALITGSSRGIGAATARALASAGLHVVINFRQAREQADELALSIENAGRQALTVQCDVSDPKAVDAMVDAALKRFGRVDVLVNNASGPIGKRPVTDLLWDDILRELEVHVRGAFNCVTAVLPHLMKSPAARVVNVGSIYAWDAPPANMAGYVVAKGALKALTHALAVELGPKGITVNMVSPGMTQTDLLSDVPERLQKVEAMQAPLRRIADPADVASAITYLASESAKFITGADIPVCGGVAM